jgi:hypothetical protein
VTVFTAADGATLGEVARVRLVADPDRQGGGGLSVRTLLIASAGSLTAAVLTSRLFPPGTIYASALTPVIVAAVSEVLNRPADRVSELRRQRRTLVLEASRAPLGEEGAALRGAPEFAQGAAADEELVTTNGSGHEPPIRIHRPRRRLLHPKVWIATGLVAFAVAAALLTLPELIFGGAVATTHRTTFFGGGSSPRTHTQTQTTETQTKTTTQQKTVTQTVPAQTPSSTTDTQTTPTATQPTTTDTGTQTTPSGGTPVPGDTGTATTPTAPPQP